MRQGAGPLLVSSRTCRYFPCGSPPRSALNRSVSPSAPTGVEGAPNSEHRGSAGVALIAGRESTIERAALAVGRASGISGWRTVGS
jgi:hypothetical protein